MIKKTKQLNSSTTGRTSCQTCGFGCKYILEATGWWPLLFGRGRHEFPGSSVGRALKSLIERSQVHFPAEESDFFSS